MHHRVVLHRRKRIVVVVQQFFPFRILRRLSKTLGVRLDRFPADQQNISKLLFNAPLQPIRNVAIDTADEGRRRLEVALKGGFFLRESSACGRINDSDGRQARARVYWNAANGDPVQTNQPHESKNISPLRELRVENETRPSRVARQARHLQLTHPFATFAALV